MFPLIGLAIAFVCFSNSVTKIRHFHSIRDGDKAELLHCLEELISLEKSIPNPSVEVLILNGAAIVNILKPVNSKTFQDYANNVFLPYSVSTSTCLETGSCMGCLQARKFERRYSQQERERYQKTSGSIKHSSPELASISANQ